ncbi:MAG: DUF58 domain-containing protein [Holophagaceae bacterium]|nr:DUF58 domain-containing protein [Holophagaceae bacterium]
MFLWKDRRLRLNLTRLGIQYLVALFLVGAFSVNTGNNLLYVIFSLMLGLFLVSGWVSRAALRGLAPASLEEGNLFARVRGGLRVRFKDKAPARLRALEVHLEMEGGRVEPGFLAGGDKTAGEPLLVLHARCEKRGWTKISSLEIRTSYPFGFVEKALRFTLDQSVLVLPHPRTNILPPRAPKGEVRRNIPVAGESSPEGSRPLRPGDAPSRVHWKRTAQRGHPWVRTFEGEQPEGLHLRLELKDWASGRPFERELERLSGAILQARLQKRDVSLEIFGEGFRREAFGHTACWRALAVAEPEGVVNAALILNPTGPLAIPIPGGAHAF